MRRDVSLLLAGVSVMMLSGLGLAQTRVVCEGGTLEGTRDEASGVRTFRGIPFAAPPVGGLRWKPPQPVMAWEGVRRAHRFGPRAMQRRVFADMVFRSDAMSEDCLYLNVWAPDAADGVKRPVLVYFFGGGFIAGDGSEGRYDGESMARQGIVAVTVNYRLGVFGFFAHPELTRESPHGASGNYGLLDQHAALAWVRRNIAAFGGDPERVTVAGESAGAISVCAQMVSPLSKGLIAGAIGESGSLLGPPLAAVPLAEAEASGMRFAACLGLGESPSLEALRALSAERLLEATARKEYAWPMPTVDGYFFPDDPARLYAAGAQAHVPLLAGVNTEEAGFRGVLGNDAPTVENYRKALQRLFKDKADEAFRLYPAADAEGVMDAAQELAGDRFIGHSTWKWLDAVTRAGGAPVYGYLFARPRPIPRASAGQGDGRRFESRGAVHSAEIEYALGNLALNAVYDWTEEDVRVSRQMQAYFVNFIATGNPNGAGLPAWPQFSEGRRLVIDVQSRTECVARLRERHAFLDAFLTKPAAP